MGSYNSNPDFTFRANMATALCFVPNDDIDRQLDGLTTALTGECVLNLFEDNYIGRPHRW